MRSLKGPEPRWVAAIPLAAIALLWLWPSAGLVLSIIIVCLLAPWGQRFGERVVLTVIAALFGVAIPLLLSQLLHIAPPMAFWRLLVTVALIACSAMVYRRPRAVPVWPAVHWADGVALATGAVISGALFVPIMRLDQAQSLTLIATFWDNSSHLPMFVQVMHAGGWNVSALSNDLLFSVYPMLHVGLWSVGEWVAGVAPATPGSQLIESYALWSALTAGIAASLVVWASAVVARSLARGWEWLAAVFTASWCLLGSMTAMADYAFSNFLLAGALAIAGVAVGARSRAAMRSLGWWALPLTGVVVTYLYPPVVAGVIGAGLVWWGVLIRDRDPLRVRSTVALVVAALLLIPAVRLVTEPFAGRQAGAITGGMPLFEWAVALVLAIVIVVMLMVVRRDRTLPSRLALSVPVLATCAIALMFASQAVRAGLSLSMSYYTLKVIYALLLMALPIAMALGAGAWGARQPRLRSSLMLAAVVAVAISVITVPSGGAWKRLPAGVSAPIPASVRAILNRYVLLTFPVNRSTAILRAGEVSDEGWVTLPVVRGKAALTDARLVAGMASVLTRRVNDVAEVAWKTPAALADLLRTDAPLRIQFVVGDSDVPDFVAALEREFGSDRVRVIRAS